MHAVGRPGQLMCVHALGRPHV